jgi:hypothetical protein
MSKASKKGPAEKKPEKRSAAGGGGSGNVVIDLGETIEKKLRAAGLSGSRAAASASKISGSKSLYSPFKSAAGNRPGMFGGPRAGAFSAYRPGMFGGYRPWYSRFGGRPWLGQEAAAAAVPYAPPGRWGLLPAQLQQVKTTELLTGMAFGVLGNRALVRLTPLLFKPAAGEKPSKLLHEALAFGAGLVPLLFKRNPTTLGVAVPGAVIFAASLVDKLYDAINLPKADLAGGDGAPRVDAALAARQKLAAIQQRIGAAQTQAHPYVQPASQVQRRQVYAQPQPVA